MSERIYNFPLLRTGNGPRSILAEAAFITAFRYSKTRTGVFTSLPLARIDRLSLGTKRRDIGAQEGAATLRPDMARLR
jgi:arsenate reductase